MPRNPVVSRTITTTIANCLCLDVKSGKTGSRELLMIRSYGDDKSLLRALQKRYDSDALKVLMVKSKTVKKCTYVMDEEQFIITATKIENE